MKRITFYFVHSFYATTGGDTAATCEYLVPFSAALQRDNFFATQFHPEKSGLTGAKILQNFINLTALRSIMIEIIPAIDIIDGKCVRLSQGDYGQKTIYNENPLEVAKMFLDAGLKRLHLVDLDGAKAHHIVNQAVLQKIASHTDLIIDFGGGLKSDEDLKIAFESGASMVTGGSIAVKVTRGFLCDGLKNMVPTKSSWVPMQRTK